MQPGGKLSVSIKKPLAQSHPSHGPMGCWNGSCKPLRNTKPSHPGSPNTASTSLTPLILFFLFIALSPATLEHLQAEPVPTEKGQEPETRLRSRQSF